MTRTMIALVSDQRMQNVIPILQTGVRYESLVLVLSRDRRTGEPLPRFLRSCDDLKAVLEPHLEVAACEKLVDPYDIDAVAAVVGSLLDGDPGRIVVNISGGTKPMAIGALRAAQSAGVTCLYTNTEDNEIIWMLPDGSTDSEPIRVDDLDVSLYIRAYGEEVASACRVADLDTAHRVWAEIIGDNHSIVYQNVVVPVTSAIKKAREDGTGLPAVREVKPTRRQRTVIERLAREGLWEWNQSTSQIVVADKVAASFLHGDWVEVYVATRLHSSDLFDDVLLNVKLKGVEGEIDVAAVTNGKLVLVECKSNVQRTEQLAKLDSFRRRLGGPFAQAYYARASESYARQIRQQCNKMRLNGVFFGAELRDIGKDIGKNMGVLNT